MLRKILLALLALLGVALAAGAGYYFWLTSDIAVSSKPPAAPTLVVAPTSAATTTTASTARIYRIDPEKSQASYTVDETFFDMRGLVTVTGTTNGVAGDILVDYANPSASKIGEIVVDISQLRTDERSRDNAIRRGWLESARYPLATFKNTTASGLPAQWVEGEAHPFTLEGDMTVREATRRVSWAAEVTFMGDTLHGKATASLKMSDFGVTPPSLEILRVEDDIVLRLDFIATATDNALATPSATP